MKKDAPVERKLYKDMSRLVSAFSFSWSKWNNQKHHEKKFVFRAKGTLSWEHELEAVEAEDVIVKVSTSETLISELMLDDFDKEVRKLKIIHKYRLNGKHAYTKREVATLSDKAKI